MTENISTAYEDRTRQSVLDVQQRNRLESVQSEIRRNNNALTTLRRENRELKQALLQARRGQKEIDMEAHYAAQEEAMHNKMAVLKRGINGVRGKNAELLAELAKTAEENRVVLAEADAGLDENSPTAQKIRALENRLDKCLIKYNEITAIKRTYETLLERLQLEQSGFDTQVAATERNLQSAEKELKGLREVGKEAAKSRDAAKNEVVRLRTAYAELRREHKKDMETRRAFVQEKREGLREKHDELLQKMEQQEERHERTMQATLSSGAGGGSGTGGKKRAIRSGAGSVCARPEEEERMNQLREQYSRLKEATVAHTAAEVIRKFNERRSNNQQLQQTAAALEAAAAETKAERARLQKQWDQLNLKAGGALVSPALTRRVRDQHKGIPVSNNNNNDNNNNEGSGAAGEAGEASAEGHSGNGLSAAYTKDFRLLGDRRHENNTIIGEFKSHLEEKTAEVAEAQQQQERLNLLLLEVENGISGFAERLQVIRPDEVTYASFAGGSTSQTHQTNTNTHLNSSNYSSSFNNSATHNNNNTTNNNNGGGGSRDPFALADNCTDLLRNCAAKIQLNMEGLTEGDIASAAEILQQNKFIIPESNVRLPAVVKAMTAAQKQNATAPNNNNNNNNNENVWGSPQHQGSVTVAGEFINALMNNNNNNNNATTPSSPAAGGGQEGAAGKRTEEFPENEIRDRRELKMMAMQAVEREEKKERKRQNQRKQSTI